MVTRTNFPTGDTDSNKNLSTCYQASVFSIHVKINLSSQVLDYVNHCYYFSVLYGG